MAVADWGLGLTLLAVLVRWRLCGAGVGGQYWARTASAMRWMAWVRMAGEVAKLRRTNPAPPWPKTWPELSATRAWSRNIRAGPAR